MPSPRIIAGAMSGTSADGIDIALVRIEGKGLQMSAKLILHHYHAYDESLRSSIFDCRNTGSIRLADLATMGHQISHAYALAVNEALILAKLTSKEIAAIAAHGQTLFHNPPDTIQWFDPALVAAETNCTVISDFRRADCAAGGQGAPLVPFADFLLFSHPEKHRVLLNLGGIANVTYLPAAGSLDSLLAFDTGPSNCISDWLMRQMNPEGAGVDTDGVLASITKPDDTLALKILANPFFKQPPPKSTDGPRMIDIFFNSIQDLGPRGKLPKNLATACLITATSIVRALREFLPHFPDEIIASGGGTKNRAIMSFLKTQLAGVPLKTTDDFGIPSDAKEAIAFALLGAATLDNEPANVPAATGAKRRVVLGSITPARMG